MPLEIKMRMWYRYCTVHVLNHNQAKGAIVPCAEAQYKGASLHNNTPIY